MNILKNFAHDIDDDEETQLDKFAYDLWGDTVNTASRMESSGEEGKIQISEETYKLIKDKFEFYERGKINVKGKGEMNTYFILGKK
ncbi:MAG: hypothetical protein KDK36_21020 [Leptospiraceae bacterium]|nr:hypothetical protein [Leptospiraceae bacterium]